MKQLIHSILSFIIVLPAYTQQSPALFTQPGSRHTNIDFINTVRENDALNVLAYEYFYNGGGVAIGDINNDGLADIYFTANLKSNKLYLNKGNLQFEDITKTAGVGGRKDWKTGVTMADVNGDGWLDIYVCYSGKGTGTTRRNELYINNGKLGFKESAAAYGLADEGCSTQAVFFDYDLDGDLDCYVLNHNIKTYRNIELQYLKTEYDPLAADRLYRNDGNRFVDVSKQAGISGNPLSFGLGIAVSDINNDGWPDIYVSNDYTEQDYCYINNRNGSFSSREHYMFGHLSQFSMGSDIADINNDGLVDIMTLDMLPGDNRRQKLLQAQENYELYQDMATNGFHFQFMRNMLQLNNGNGTFSEIGQLAGISNTDWSWAALFADLDNDGHKDLYVTNGYMRDYTNKDFLKYWGDYLVKQVVKRDSINYMDIIKMMPVTLLPNYAFRNSGDLAFTDVSAAWGLDQRCLSNGAAYGDLDNDGDLDIVINNINEEAGVYRNESDRLVENNFLKIQLNGLGKNRYGIGTKVRCYANGVTQFLEQMPARGYQSSVTEILHFGLGTATVVDSVVVTWPIGTRQVISKIKANQLIRLDEEKATHTIPSQWQPAKRLFTFEKPLFAFNHLQLEYNDFKRQPLMPVMLSPCGPRFIAGDINGDGRDDIFIGGSQGQASECYLQDKMNGFTRIVSDDLVADSFSTTSDIILFDADNDGDRDVYTVSGGYADYDPDDSRLQDRLFINDGVGHFTRSKQSIPLMTGSRSCVAAADFDRDGDMDLFVGGRVVPGAYPQAPPSYLMINDGKGNFSHATTPWNRELATIGMVTDAHWIDINGDKWPELFLIGEWMNPVLFRNTGKGLEKMDAGFDGYAGWWNTAEWFDMDHDGDMDLIAGNWGLNSQVRASRSEPATMFWDDFDNNGSVDPFLNYYIQGVPYPYVSRDELLDQVYPMRKKFTSYKAYADATMNDIFSVQELDSSKRLVATELATTLFENVNGRFVARKLPVQAQFAPVYKIVIYDWDHDGHDDILLLGNNNHPRLRMGKMDANFGTVLLNDGKGEFRHAGYSETGLLVAGDVKDATVISTGGDRHLLIGINNEGWMHYKLNK